MSKSMHFALSAVLLANLISLAALAGLDSPFRSTVPGLSIANSHVLVRDSRGEPAIVRGRAPKNTKELQELKSLGVTDFLIFKNDTKGEVAKQIQDLKSLGYSAKNVLNVPFPWKDLRDPQDSCKMTLKALLAMQKAEREGRVLYFHCTVGEDRTGYLAALYLLASGRARDVRSVFKTEMCDRGYEAGDPKKPLTNVVKPIRETLTPTFVVMADLLLRNGLRADLCKGMPKTIEPFATQGFVCSPSPHAIK